MIIPKEVTNCDTREAYYDIEEGSPKENIIIKEGKFNFTWNRKISNDNINQEGFSFYFARRVFEDKYKVIDIGLGNDPHNTGILGIVPGSPKTMIIIYAPTDYLLKGVIKIVSAHYVTSQELKDKYSLLKKMKSMRPSDKEIEKLAEYIRKIIRDPEDLANSVKKNRF